ncbi:MAG: hypothetical protein JWR50_4362 [Mucilaginibacter sp.]|nr:hypothetical protein [Mucilaginibacter sp.]
MIVVDKEAPKITTPASVTVNTDAGVCQASGVNIGTATATDNCVVPTITSDAPAIFPKGNTTVTWTATDASGNYSKATQVVIVVDKEAPKITAPASITVNTDAGKCQASGVNISRASAIDNCDIKSITNNAPAIFPKGSTTVTWTATDTSGNSSSATQVVTVVDKEAPTISHTNVVVNTDLGKCSAIVGFTAPVVADNCGIASVVCNPPSGSEFSKGTNTVTCTVVDTSGNSAKTTFTVVVSDKEAPKITCPADITVEFKNTNGVTVAFTVLATDNCPGVQVVSVPASGSVFPIGTTVVTNTATDASGNKTVCTFQVTVLGAKGTKADLLKEMKAIRPTVTDKEAGKKLDSAIEEITESLDPSFWINQTHLNPKTGKDDFDEERDAVTDLQVLQSQSKKHNIPIAVIQGWIDRIVASDRLIATIAINDAATVKTDAKCVADALKMISQGDKEASKGNGNSAIVLYRNAWSAIVSCKGDKKCDGDKEDHDDSHDGRGRCDDDHSDWYKNWWF